jgi:hypothetical protein
VLAREKIGTESLELDLGRIGRLAIGPGKTTMVENSSLSAPKSHYKEDAGDPEE